MKTLTINPRIIRFEDKAITVKMMDNSWIINECITHGPIKPRHGIVWAHSDHCARLRIPGDEYEKTMNELMGNYGNCAVIAWDGDLALGHIIFVPKIEARKKQMLYYERMPKTSNDSKTLVIEAVGFCSIRGNEYRGHGIGKTMAKMVIDWAVLNGWKTIQIYGAPPGLSPWAWLDSCMPPLEFWQKFDFQITKKAKIKLNWEQFRDTILADNPRENTNEKRLKEEIIAKIEQGKVNEEDWAYEYDLEKKLNTTDEK